LIAHTGGFQNGDFHFNPSYDSIAVDVEFLDILHNKARTLERLAYLQDNPGLKKDYLLTGAETVKLATRGIKDLRKTYLSEDSRLYLAENEKETYLTSIRISNELFNLTADTGYINNAYNVVMEAKSSVLKQRIEDHRIFFSLGLSDSLRIKLQKIVKDISVYNHLIYNELNGPDPDQKKLDYWKDELFRLNREKELNEKDIFQMYPNIPEIVQKTEPVTIADIRKKLGKDETLIEYFLSNQYISGKRKLYIFTLTGHSIFLSENELDSIFRYDLEILKKNVYHATLQTTDEREYITALFRMYDKLFKPLEGIINGNRLIIIPDEEIALLPFDSFIKKIPEGNRVYFDGLQYLVREYIFSYGYSSSLVFSKQKSRAFSTSVYAFSPYHEDGAENKAAAGNYLGGTLKEINAIFDHFKGRRFTGIEASEKNFKSVMEDQAIFHLAMHAITDTLNTQYSCLVFNHDSSEAEDGRLFNYEIGLSRIRSPMVVLSACNTGTGELYHGEGVMSLARGFILAGASSVIKTAWDVNDESSARIIMSFYSFLFKGKPKDEALRLAKLEYLKNSPPTYSHPFFWAAYEVMGDNSPVVVRKNYRFIVIFSGILLVVTACSIYFFRRRRIFSARSL
jgi:CHAT domain-containing protein